VSLCAFSCAASRLRNWNAQPDYRECTFIPALKKDVLPNQSLAEAEYNKNNTYLRLGSTINYFKKFDKLLAEPRNIRQQLSKQFALKLEGNLKSNRKLK
jgi:hypothetical protein